MSIINIFFAVALPALTAHAADGSSYSVSADLHEVSNLASFRRIFVLRPQHLRALKKNLFFTCPSNDEALRWVYGFNDYRSIPSIVTVDNVLDVYHVFFESSLRSVEKTRLLPDVTALTQMMLTSASAQYLALPNSPLRQAALKNAAFFGVADRLLGVKDSIPDAALPLVRTELASIRAHQGKGESAIFSEKIDYSQFIVRGHYTKTPALGRYFLSMMWYGLMPFKIALEKGSGFEQAQQAMLISRDLAEGKAAGLWNRIYDVTSLFAGKSNNLTPKQWNEVSDQVFGSNAPLSAYTDNGKLELFKRKLAAMPRPPIASSDDAGAVVFRFMGQRAIPDSRMLKDLSDYQLRPFPDPLDVMAVLGSTRAAQILDSDSAEYNSGHWSEYVSTRNGLRTFFSALPAENWSQDLYWAWLDCLHPLLQPAPAGYPSFMRKSAWVDKSLYSALACWAELRHDTLLYGFQSVSEGDGDDQEPPFVKGYVEPNLPVYKRLLVLVSQSEEGLKSRGYLPKDVEGQYKDFKDLIDFLVDVSKEELAGTKLSREEHDQIRHIESELDPLYIQIQVIANGTDYQQLSADDLDTALVADVHTANDEVLTVGVGRADHLFAIVPIDGKLYLARGSALSFYSFLKPVSERMTDQQWKAQLNDGKTPAKPAWTSSFYVPIPVKEKEKDEVSEEPQGGPPIDVTVRKVSKS